MNVLEEGKLDTTPGKTPSTSNGEVNILDLDDNRVDDTVKVVEKKFEEPVEEKNKIDSIFEVDGIRVLLSRDVLRDNNEYKKEERESLDRIKEEIDGALLDLDKDELDLLKSKGVFFNIISSPTNTLVFDSEKMMLNIDISEEGRRIENAIQGNVIPQIREESQAEEPAALETATEEVVPEVEATTSEVAEVDAEKLEPPHVAEPEPEIFTERIPASPEAKDPEVDVVGVDKVEGPAARAEIVEPEGFDEDFNKLTQLRTAKASIESDFKKGNVTQEYFDEITKNYAAQREIVAGNIRNNILDKHKGALTEDYQIREAEAEINNKIFEELVVKEHEAYIQELRSNRDGDKQPTTFSNAVEKTMGALRAVTSAKSMAWYWKLSPMQRRLVNTGIAAAAVGVGTFALGGGTAAAVGAVGYRVARGVASIGGSALGMNIGTKIEKNVQEKSEEALAKIKEAEGTIEEKAAAFKAHEDYYGKKKATAAWKKAGLTFGMGLGAGALSGLAQHAMVSGVESMSTGGVASKAAESVAGKPNTGAAQNLVDTTPKPPAVEKLFSDPVVEVKRGDSFWKVLGNTLDENEKFKALSSAQKQSIMSSFVGRAINDPDKYGFTPDEQYGIKIEVGQKLDFSKLLEEQGQFDKALTKASSLGENLQNEILQNELKIKEYLRTHPGEQLTVEKTNEILSTKIDPSKVATGGNWDNAEFDKDVTVAMADTPEAPEVAEVTPDMSDTPETPENVIHDQPLNKAPLEEHFKNVPLEKTPEENWMPDNFDKNQLASNNVPKPETPSTPNMSDPHFIMDNVSAVKAAFKQGIDSVYGKSGFMGLWAKEGMNTPEWKFMNSVSAKGMLEYYTGDSANTSLPVEVVKEFKKTLSHKDLAREVIELMQDSQGKIQPYKGETVGKFLERLVQFAVKNHAENNTEYA